jgi:site-specific recombinase XerD
MKRWDELAHKFISDCRTSGLSRDTLLSRESEILRFGRWLAKQQPRPRVEDVDHELILKYLKSRTTFLAKSSVSGVISHNRMFGDFLVSQGLWRSNPLNWIHGPKVNNYRKHPRNYNKSDLEKIFQSSFAGHTAYSRSIGPALISLLYSTGLRKGELLRLNVADWDRRNLTIKIYGSKTGQDRLTPVSQVVWRCLESYLQQRDKIMLATASRSDALFVNRFGNRIKGETLASVLRTAAKRAGVKRPTAHMFRHSCASDLVEQGTPIHVVQKVLGHSAVMSTFRYLTVADPLRVEAMQIKHPINDILGLKERADETI